MAEDIVRGENLGPEFEQGTTVPDKVTIKVDGTSIVRDAATGELSSPGAAPVAEIKGWANVNANGSIDSQAGGVTANRTNVGRYTMTPPAGSQVCMLRPLEPSSTRDDIVIYSTDFAGTDIHVTEQDNGGAAGTYRDRAFVCVYMGAP